MQRCPEHHRNHVHHFTRTDEINALAAIGESDNQDMGFMARLLTLCSLPRTNPGERMQYKRQNGPTSSS